MAKTEATHEISIPRMNLQMMKVRLVGDSPLICHAWSEKAKKQMLDKQMTVDFTENKTYDRGSVADTPAAAANTIAGAIRDAFRDQPDVLRAIAANLGG